MKIVIFAFFALMSAANSEKIQAILTRTADCFTCGMTFGNLGIQICGENCCSVQALDNSDLNFDAGTIDIFTGADLLECEQFNLGNFDDPLKVTLYHMGADALTLDYVRIETDLYNYMCDVYEELEDDNTLRISCN